MASRFDLLMSAGTASLFAQLAVSGWTYTPDAGDPVSLSVLAGEVAAGEDAADEGARGYVFQRVEITTDPAGPYGGVAAPSRRATLTDPAGNVWSVLEILDCSGGKATLELSRSDPLGRSRPQRNRPTRRTATR